MSDRINREWQIQYSEEDTMSLRTQVPDLAATNAQAFWMGEPGGIAVVRAIIAKEPEGWHLSVSCADRDPTYEELVTLRYRLLGAVPHMAMLFPPLEQFVNIHEHTFHFYEVAVTPS